MNLEQYKKLDRLICQRNTGNPVQLAKYLGVCERSLKNMIVVLRDRCGAPVKYDKKLCTYYYVVKGNCQFKFSPCVKEELSTAITNAIMKILPAFSIVFSCCLDY